MENKKIRVAITHGDTNGIGYELIFKTFSAPEMLDLCTPIIYGSPKVASYHCKALDIQSNFSIINKAEEAKDGRINILPCFDEDVKVDFGTPTDESGQAALNAIDRAMTDFRGGLYDVLVCAPINNDLMKINGVAFPGLQKYVETSVGEGKKALPVLINNYLCIAFATDEVAIKDIAANLNEENIINKAKILFNTIKRDISISSPRIAVMALNPTATEAEEKDIISPAIDKLEEEGINVFGPYAAETFFGEAQYTAFDGVLAMFHDQGMVPFKTLDPTSGICLLAGLPIVCTLPTTDASFDIAGKGVADESSFRNAIYTAIDTFRNRNNYDEPLANPLPKLYRERRDDSDKVRFATPKKRETQE